MSPGWRGRDADFRTGAWERLQVGYLGKNLPSPVCRGSAKTGGRFRFTRLNLNPPTRPSPSVVLLPFLPPRPSRASCPRNVPSLSEMFAGCGPF